LLDRKNGSFSNWTHHGDRNNLWMGNSVRMGAVAGFGWSCMAIADLKTIIQQYDGEYLIVEFEHLFISATLREEVWLLQSKNDRQLMEEVVDAATGFHMLEVDPDRNLESYSAGQQAILACLLTIAVIRNRNRQGLKLLLNHVLESISPANQQLLLSGFKALCLSHRMRLFVTEEGKATEIQLNG
jgi:hypothetical protein